VRIGNTPEKLTGFTDDKLNPDNGLYYYTIDAIEGVTGNGYTSRSNSIELIQSPLLYVPNAFTPNNDGLNEELNIRPVFVKDYDLKIYDRWGKLIFSTNNKYETYKDIYNNEPATSDVFVYLVTYTGWDGSTHTQRGNFTAIK
jgi:gliding motility-associated-like protein